MTDEDVATLLDSDESLVTVEAPAGCGKTYQGARFARRWSERSPRGRALILTHTHSACAEFAKETKANASKVEIRTIDSLIVHAATIYHKSLDLPPDPARWARANGETGFQQLGARVAHLLKAKPLISRALSDRYPVVIADEHQDSSADQHEIVMQLHAAGARLRIFGDPMQRIYGSKKKAEIRQERERWEGLKSAGAFAELTYPHRWDRDSPELGAWILKARASLRDGQEIDLTGVLPAGLEVLLADNMAQRRSGYALQSADRKPIDKIINATDTIFVLSARNETVKELRGFWNRRIPIWEGHVREPLGRFVTDIGQRSGDPVAVSEASLAFIQDVCVGFSASSHGDRFAHEVASGCRKSSTGKPALIQQLARCIIDNPTHVGVAACLDRLAEFVASKTSGFDAVHIDHRREFWDAVRLGDFADPEEGLAELHRRRSFARPLPPRKSISTIHKAKGLECDHALVIPCDKTHFSSTDYSRCRLYVALSRARRRLTLVVSRASPSPLFKIAENG